MSRTKFQKLGEMRDGLETRHLKSVSRCGLSAALCTRIIEICIQNAIYSFSTKKKSSWHHFVLASVATPEEILTFNCGCFQNPFGVHRKACRQMLPSKVAE